MGELPKISVIIPHRGRDNLLLWHLRELQKQSFRDFEVIVVVDDDAEATAEILDRTVEYRKDDWLIVFSSDGRGPAASRNIGANLANSDIVLFTGSDCIPDSNLLAFHYWYHNAYQETQIVQGYTPWHPDVITPFYDFLDMSGMQANWKALREDNGNWRRHVSANFCLTTNYSIKRQLILNEPFDESFKGAAWEDVQLGYRLARRQERAIFASEAVNYHYHHYDLDSFAARSRMEGYHRLTLASIHPETGWHNLSPAQLRAVQNIDLDEVLAWAHELDGAQDEKLVKEHYERMGQACTTHSFVGIWDRIKDSHPAMQALPYTESPEQLINVVSGTAAVEREEYGYGQHTGQWLLAGAPDKWWAMAFLGEMELACGNVDLAVSAFQDAVTISPAQEWPTKRLAEILS